MAFVLFKMYLNLFLLCLCLCLCWPTIVSINSTQIQCNYLKYKSIGCPEDTHMVCNNATNYCHCNQSSEYRISFGDNQCLAVRIIDQKCLTSDQCLKSDKNQLFCYFYGFDKEKSLTKLDTTMALDLKRSLNKTVEGFCRCDDNHYYDYQENQCNENGEQDIVPYFEEFFCKQCPNYDSNSHCNRKTQTCDCNDGFIKNSYGKCVPKRYLYEKCGYSDQCVVDNSYCEPIVSQCVCEYSYYADHKKLNCKEGSVFDEKCATSEECAYQYGYCDPKTWKCQCEPNQSIYFNKHCVKRTGYGQLCVDQYPDLVCELSLSHTLCSKYTNRCVCENGYLFMSDECQKININRFAFGDDFRPEVDNKNPMTYILLIFSAIFGIVIVASILFKIFGRPGPRLPLALYDRPSDQTNNDYNPEPRRPPTAPPIYSESRLRESSQTLRSNTSDNEDKPPSYEEAISGSYSANP